MEKEAFEKERFSRSEMVLSKESLALLREKTVAVFGAGGVGGAAIEALARMGVGKIHVIDADVFSASNLNRQLLSTVSDLGKNKVEVALKRIKEIDPFIEAVGHNVFYLPETADKIPFDKFDFIIDAIDTVSAKIDLAVKAKELDIPIVCALGCGNRVDPTKLVITDISKTFNDPLAKVMRRKLKEAGIANHKVVFSTEKPIKPQQNEEIAGFSDENKPFKKSVPGSLVFVPNVAGYLLAYETFRCLISPSE